MRVSFRCFCILATLSALSARADPASPSPDLGSSALQLLSGFALVLILLFVSLWLLKRLGAARENGNHLLKIVAGTAVGPREKVVVMEIGNLWLVIGVTPGQITALHQMPKETRPEQSGLPTADFAGRIQQFLSRRHAP
ncbi:MAG: flagellar biosynthetic protein FliO [Proteobacteria bacterium]|nr:flagellar biosynthetic protein FliO [Pseudomonadota bacterium]HQR05007.1 flagellar biosynthetic protein FliO [Rhodocyclaceae bacterium]